MRSINIRLREEELQRLIQCALNERRRPADQAAVLIIKGLERDLPAQPVDQRSRQLVPA
jgi:hypothetical protein